MAECLFWTMRSLWPWPLRTMLNNWFFFILQLSNFCMYMYSWLSLSRTRLTRISGWGEFLSKSRTSLCINIYNLIPVESNSDESKFRLSRIKVLVPRCRKPYYLHSLSRIYLSRHVYYLGIKIGSQVKHPVIDWPFYLRLFHMFISQSVKLISDNIWIGLVLWHRLNMYNQNYRFIISALGLAYINDYEKYTKEAFYLLNYLSEINFD